MGFDEYMNLVLDDAEEVHIKNKTKKTLRRILLKGDNIMLIQQVLRENTSNMCMCGENSRFIVGQVILHIFGR